MEYTIPQVQRLDVTHAEQVVSMLCDAFDDYPVMRFILVNRDNSYPTRLRSMIHMFVMARYYRNEPVLGILNDMEVMAGALISYPDTIKHPPEFFVLRDAVWQELGEDAHSRYETFNNANKPFSVAVPYIHLNMIGVRRKYQGMGLGNRLMEEVHRLSAEDSRSEGVSLTTESNMNVPFYERRGYKIMGHTRVAPDLETWAFFRPDRQRKI